MNYTIYDFVIAAKYFKENNIKNDPIVFNNDRFMLYYDKNTNQIDLCIFTLEHYQTILLIYDYDDKDYVEIANCQFGVYDDNDRLKKYSKTFYIDKFPYWDEINPLFKTTIKKFMLYIIENYQNKVKENRLYIIDKREEDGEDNIIIDNISVVKIIIRGNVASIYDATLRNKISDIEGLIISDEENMEQRIIKTTKTNIKFVPLQYALYVLGLYYKTYSTDNLQISKNINKDENNDFKHGDRVKIRKKDGSICYGYVIERNREMHSYTINLESKVSDYEYIIVQEKDVIRI